MKDTYEKVSLDSIQRSHFDQSHYRSLTLSQGKLVPVFLKETLPGDSFNLTTTSMVRLFPMDAPIFQEMALYIHYFWVPIRQIWDEREFETFITGSKDGQAIPIESEPIPPFIPNMQAVNFAPGGLLDHLGYPTTTESAAYLRTPISILPVRAYAAIYNYWYRDENLISPIDISKTSGEDSVTIDSLYKSAGDDDNLLLRRAWTKDYFTSAFTSAQKGSPVYLPLTGNLEVKLGSYSQKTAELVSNVTGTRGAFMVRPDGTNTLTTDNTDLTLNVLYDPRGTLVADASTGVSSSINEFRDAIALQRFKEIMQVGGSRYDEFLLSMFGVVSDDLRLQKPMYLGGGKQNISISEVLQTSESTASSPQGNYAGHGISLGDTVNINETFKEHGYIMGIASILPKPYYQQGLPKHLTRFDRYDYALPIFANLGEQEILNQELYFQFDDQYSQNEQTFGYQQRYAEYKDTMSSIHGDFKTSLSYWHQGRIFDSLPGLNKEFIECNPSHRIFPVQGPNVHHFYMHMYHDLGITRPLPIIAKPGMI